MNDGEFYRKRARQRLVIVGIVVVIAAAAAAYAIHAGSFEQISALETSAEHDAAQKLAQTFSAPSPLVATGTPQSAYTLTRAGIIAETNIQRAVNGNLPPLAEDTTLDDIAQIRLDDMFTKQYFAHISPSSSSAVTVAQAVGYDYIALGENLALGNFPGDAGVVTAWMNSPGHRANILDVHYTNIGVAAREGNFQGENVWIAVQILAARFPIALRRIRRSIPKSIASRANSRRWKASYKPPGRSLMR